MKTTNQKQLTLLHNNGVIPLYQPQESFPTNQRVLFTSQQWWKASISERFHYTCKHLILAATVFFNRRTYGFLSSILATNKVTTKGFLHKTQPWGHEITRLRPNHGAKKTARLRRKEERTAHRNDKCLLILHLKKSLHCVSKKGVF